MREKPVEYFYSLVGTRQIDPKDGLQYEVTEVKVNKKQEIVAYWQRFYKSQYEGNVDGSYHVADIYSYTKINLDMLFKQRAENRDTSPMESNSVARGSSKVLAGDAVRGSLKQHWDVDAATTRLASNGVTPNTLSEESVPRDQISRVCKRPELYKPPSIKACNVNTMLKQLEISSRY
jgi:hypothetical protein